MPSRDPNPLFIRRRVPAINRGEELDEIDVSISAAMAEEFFTSTAEFAEFGGPVTGWNHDAGRVVGTLERTPPNNVHGGVGGLMNSFETAALDPIFWLHHANIDRLWEVWLGRPWSRGNPTEADWLNMEFKVGGGASAVTLRVRKVIDTTQPPLTYSYSDVSLPAPVRDAVTARFATEARLAQEEEPMRRDIFPELVGASEDRVPLTDRTTEVEVPIEPPTGPAFRERAEGAQPRKVYLKVENVTGKELTAHNYLVYVDLPPGADPTEYEDRRAGQVPMFGVREASESDAEHSGSGLTYSYDITSVVQHLRETGEWDPERLRVTFTPVRPSAAQGGDVSAGRVSLFYA
jgi:tyrosinase